MSSEASTVRYKVVETSTVTGESLEATIGEWVSDVLCVVREGSHSPAMGSVLFFRARQCAREGGQEA